ncbi:tetratricopeptide repeat protein [Aliikangiella sp. G2MR2-5]|uniref:tetratricopeptide repeat protein n=1 Tax=Aliikangiella sp. G2MR2-5 TaxID=2788943 RepID=UPI0018A97798|nr:tetratricopeptide repeat protein [Aliikangiella sp. G2MR2-5]
MKQVYLLGCILFSLALSASGKEVKGKIDNLAFQNCDSTCESLFVRLKKFARNGSPQAQTLLALAFKNGEGVSVDDDKAWLWIQRAARQRFAPAMHILGRWHYDGYKTSANKELAEKYFKRSVDKNYGPAMFDLGILYLASSRDSLAIEQFSKAANRGSQQAIEILRTVAPDKMSEFDNVLQNSSDMPPKGEQELQGENIVTIYSDKQSHFDMLFNIVEEIDSLGVYDSKGTTGSRTGYRKCGMAGSGCKLLNVDDFIMAFSLNDIVKL